MSFFSSFDALFGQKATRLPLERRSGESNGDDAAAVNGTKAETKSEGGTVKASKKGPRFAVELDGVHCFETVVSY
ncbi:hypothetical protein LINPERHAP2_LOCUS29192 [Linum perenne]